MSLYNLIGINIGEYKTIGELNRHFSPRPTGSATCLQVRKEKSPHPINAGVYEEFPALDDALEWRKTARRRKIFCQTSQSGKCKLGYYEFEGEDKEPEEEEESIILLNTADCEQSVD